MRVLCGVTTQARGALSMLIQQTLVRCALLQGHWGWRKSPSHNHDGWQGRRSAAGLGFCGDWRGMRNGHAGQLSNANGQLHSDSMLD